MNETDNLNIINDMFDTHKDKLYDLSNINIVDVVLLVNTILDSSFNPSGDINGDGIVNVLDVVAVVSLVLGK